MMPHTNSIFPILIKVMDEGFPGWSVIKTLFSQGRALGFSGQETRSIMLQLKIRMP